MIWLLGLAFVGVVAAKYYTAFGSRNLERRLGSTRGDLEGARRKLREVREKQEGIKEQEDLMILRVRYMKELMDDMKARLNMKDERTVELPSREEVVSAALLLR